MTVFRLLCKKKKSAPIKHRCVAINHKVNVANLRFRIITQIFYFIFIIILNTITKDVEIIIPSGAKQSDQS